MGFPMLVRWHRYIEPTPGPRLDFLWSVLVTLRILILTFSGDKLHCKVMWHGTNAVMQHGNMQRENMQPVKTTAGAILSKRNITRNKYSLLMHGIKFESFAKFIFGWKKTFMCGFICLQYMYLYMYIYIYLQKRLYHRPIVSTMTKAQWTAKLDSCTALYCE